jgi:vancomycin resistance protein YoaR
MRHTPPPMDPGATQRRPSYRAILACALVAIVLPLVAFGIDTARHTGRVVRGVRVGALRLGGLDLEQARQRLAEHAAGFASDVVVVHVGEAEVKATLEELGFRVDVERTLENVMAGRRERGVTRLVSWFRSFASELDVGATADFDRSRVDALLERWNREIVPRPFEGAIAVKDGEPVAEPPRIGYVVDEAATRAAATEAASAIAQTEPGVERSFRVTLLPHHPLRDAALVDAALVRAKELVAGSLSLYIDRSELAISEKASRGKRKVPAKRPRAAGGREEPDQRITATFTKAQLLEALRSRLVDEPLAVEPYLDPAVLDPMLGDLRKVIEEPTTEPHFEIDPRERPLVVPGKLGRVVKSESVASALASAALVPERLAKLPIEPGAPPTRTTAELETLGIKMLVAKFTTSHPCCMPRVDNIHRIADMLDGAIVKPGELLSVNAIVGERTVEKGFKAAPTIVYGEMEDTIGGGISQFATTLFNAAFYGGYDIVERKPHSFYIARYPMGHEATLSYPKPDLVIRNDTDAGLLVRCFYTSRSITVKLYGDNGGRRVRRKVHPVHDVVKPPIEYLPDPTLEPEKVKVKERGQVGWTVTVSRILDFPDGSHRTEERKVVYQPRVRRVRVHPCKIPVGDKAYTGEKCPEDENAAAEAHEPIEVPAEVPREGVTAPDAPVEDEG